MKQLEIAAFPHGWDAIMGCQDLQFSGFHLYSWVDTGVSCLSVKASEFVSVDVS